MAKQSLSTIKNWFKTSQKPSQSQFWDSWDSFWHKDQKIPINCIDKLDEILLAKASGESVNNIRAGIIFTSVDGSVEINEFDLSVPDKQLADDEDIELVGSPAVLKFKDKPFSAEEYSGLGTKILRRNIVSGYNVLSQNMLIDTNTIYIIQYDFDLKADSITIPDGCILKFIGGSIFNGGIVLNNTLIQLPKFFNVNFSGTLGGMDVDAIGFGAEKTGAISCHTLLNQLIQILKYGYSIKLKTGVYRVTEPIVCNYYTKLIGDGIDKTTIDATAFAYKTDGDYDIISVPVVTIQSFIVQIESMRIVGTKSNVARVTGLHIYNESYEGGTLTTNIELRRSCFKDLYITSASYGMVIGFNLGLVNTYNIFAEACSIIGIKCSDADSHHQLWKVTYCTNGILIDTGNSFFYGLKAYQNGKCYYGEDYALTYGIKVINSRNLIEADVQENYSDGIIFYLCADNIVKILSDANGFGKIALANNVFKGDGVKIINCSSINGLISCSNFAHSLTQVNGLVVENSNVLNLQYTESDQKEYSKIDDSCYSDGISIKKPTDMIAEKMQRGFQNLISDTDFITNGTIWRFGPSLIQAETDAEKGVLKVNGSLSAIPRYSVKPVLIPENYYLLRVKILGNDGYNLIAHIWDNSNYVEYDSMSVVCSGEYREVIYAFKAPIDSLTADIQLSFTDRGTAQANRKDIFIKEWVIIDISEFSNLISVYYELGDSQIKFNLIKTALNKALLNKYINCGYCIPSNVSVSGTFANKPTIASNLINIGYRYFCTDRQTIEGAIPGIVITHKGTDIWVDALGRVVS
jgi:hypothetical protein